jgi:trimethylamine--corrinoid protein Co-methyltransferase
MSAERQPLEPLQPAFRVQYATSMQLDQLQEATLNILERTGVRFPSEKALKILAEHGAQVDKNSQVVKFPRDLVFKAMSSVPRYFKMGALDPFYDLNLKDGTTYFTTDGCGVETIDLETRTRRPSSKADVAMMARVADYLPSVGFVWPMVSAQDHGHSPAA